MHRQHIVGAICSFGTDHQLRVGRCGGLRDGERVVEAEVRTNEKSDVRQVERERCVVSPDADCVSDLQEFFGCCSRFGARACALAHEINRHRVAALVCVSRDPEATVQRLTADVA